MTNALVLFVALGRPDSGVFWNDDFAVVFNEFENFLDESGTFF